MLCCEKVEVERAKGLPKAIKHGLIVLKTRSSTMRRMRLCLTKTFTKRQKKGPVESQIGSRRPIWFKICLADSIAAKAALAEVDFNYCNTELRLRIHEGLFTLISFELWLTRCSKLYRKGSIAWTFSKQRRVDQLLSHGEGWAHSKML